MYKRQLYVRIDRKRKFLGTIFLRALGLRSDEEILKTFYTVDRLHIADGKLQWAVQQDPKAATHLVGAKPAHALLHNGEEIAHSGRKITAHTLKSIRAAAIDRIEVEAAELDGAVTAADVVDLNTGEVVVEANVELTADRLHNCLLYTSPHAVLWVNTQPLDKVALRWRCCMDRGLAELPLSPDCLSSYC